jgi:predicted DCC family thiol-disulfide oxidoreductase YuxK
LFDGECGFCSRVVLWVLRHERQQTLQFAPLESPVARRLLQQHPECTHADSVLWVDMDETMHARRILARSAAALQLCGYLGGAWNLLRVAWLIPRPLRDAVYDLVARNRHRLLGARPCPLPTPEQRRRFLGDPSSGLADGDR